MYWKVNEYSAEAPPVSVKGVVDVRSAPQEVAPNVAVPTDPRLLVPIQVLLVDASADEMMIEPLILAEALLTISFVGTTPSLALPWPLLPSCAIDFGWVTGVSNKNDSVGVGPGDAEAGGAATAVKITGTVQATPATTLRRLKPLLLTTSSFKISDKSSPQSSFEHGQLGLADTVLGPEFRLHPLFPTGIKIPASGTQALVKIRYVSPTRAFTWATRRQGSINAARELRLTLVLERTEALGVVLGLAETRLLGVFLLHGLPQAQALVPDMRHQFLGSHKRTRRA